MKYLFIFVSLLFIMSSSLGQDHKMYDSSEYKIDNRKKNLTHKPYQFNIQTGISYTSVNRKEGYFSNFVYPNISYRLSSRFILSGGIIAIKNYLNNYNEYAGANNNSYSSTYFIGRGSYLLNNKLSFHGYFIKTIDNPVVYPNESPINRFNQNYSFGIDYKITNSISFGVQFRSAERNSLFDYYYPE